ncbi:MULTISPECIES: alpha/beta fold hydrolase [unclassified Nocardioides]|uniref:alpha/beta fold hydrolase n=1 Tax=unclassified Nocardioides TaxID=2615069 RepID=UPI003606DDAA
MHQSVWTDLRNVEFSQRWVNAGGIRTRVLEAGDRANPTVVFIHGTGGHAEAYTRNLGPHAEHFHVYSIDMVGHGFTDKPDQTYDFKDYADHLRAFLDAEGIERASISGESMGAGIGAWFALLHPDRIDKLVLNTGAALRLADDVIQRMATLTMEAVRNATEESVRKRLEWLVDDPADVTEDLVSTRLAIYQNPDYVERMTNILAARHTDPAGQDRNCLVEEDWAKVACPVLVLWTDHDPTAPPEVGREVADWIPESRFELMTGCGHWPQFEDADTFNKIHLDFLLAT